MEHLLVDAHWQGSLKFSDEVKKYLEEKGVKKIALFASVNFLKLDEVKEQLEAMNVEVLITKAKRTHKEGQVLGCDAYHDSFKEDIISEADATLYIGDGMFHPKALLLAQMRNDSTKPVVIWDPVNEEMKIISEEDIAKQKKRMKANLMRYMNADVVGVLVTTKWGQQFLNRAEELKEKLGKKVYIFIDDTVDLSQLENYPFIQAWVNTGCPRIGLDDITTIPQALVNIKEAFDPGKALEELSQE